MKLRTTKKTADFGSPLTRDELGKILDEAQDQPSWRINADKEADYADGNQLDSELLRRQQKLGIPPAKENIIGPAIAAICGYEAKSRTDWRVTPDGQLGGQDVADALNFRLNQAEKESKADQALSEAFRQMITVGLGWVEVAKESDPFKFPLRCRHVHRNEIHWDMTSKEKDLSDCEWLVRERYVRTARAAASFPKHKEAIMNAAGIHSMGGMAPEFLEGGSSTGLFAGANQARAWTTREYSWYRADRDEVCILEVWYRRWVSVMVLRTQNGRVVEFDESNPNHVATLSTGLAKLERVTVGRLRRAYWMGPIVLHDSESPYPHNHFPYVPCWGYREDLTGIPFGLVRDMLFPQDNLNATIGRLRWGLAAVRTERTKGAVAMTDEQHRAQVSRIDADIVLNAEAMAKQGARYEVKRDFQLNAQHFQMMQDSRAALERVSPGASAAMQGRQGTARSGLQEQTQLEQSQVSIADLMDNFKTCRAMVGEILMDMLIEDIGEEEQTVVIEGDALHEPKMVMLNKPERDPETGMLYRSNDVQRTRLKVSLEDVPTTSSFRAQQLSALSEAIKSLPQDIQQVFMPFLIDLMDLPRKKEIVQAMREAKEGANANPDAIREQVKQELMHDIKTRELELKERIGDAQIKKLMNEAVQTAVQAAFSSMQAAGQVVLNPGIAPIADKVMQIGGWQPSTPGGQDPDFPTGGEAVGINPAPAPEQQSAPEVSSELTEVRQNTSPTFPPVPRQPDQGMDGIETPAVGDNL